MFHPLIHCLQLSIPSETSIAAYSGFEVSPQAVALGFEWRLQVTIAFHIKIFWMRYGANL